MKKTTKVLKSYLTLTYKAVSSRPCREQYIDNFAELQFRLPLKGIIKEISDARSFLTVQTLIRGKKNCRYDAHQESLTKTTSLVEEKVMRSSYWF